VEKLFSPKPEERERKKKKKKRGELNRCTTIRGIRIQLAEGQHRLTCPVVKIRKSKRPRLSKKKGKNAIRGQKEEGGYDGVFFDGLGSTATSDGGDRSY